MPTAMFEMNESGSIVKKIITENSGGKLFGIVTNKRETICLNNCSLGEHDLKVPLQLLEYYPSLCLESRKDEGLVY